MDTNLTTPIAVFRTSFGDDAFGADLPAAIALRLSPEVTGSLETAIQLVESGQALSITIRTPSPRENLAYIRTIGFLPDNALAPVPGFWDGSAPAATSPEVLGADLDGESAEYQDQCTHYTLPVMEPTITVCTPFGSHNTISPAHILLGGEVFTGRETYHLGCIAMSASEVFGESRNHIESVAPQTPTA